MIQVLGTRCTRMPATLLELARQIGRHRGDEVHLVVAQRRGPGEGLGDGLVDDAPDLRSAPPVPVEGLDDQVVVLDQLHEAEGAGAHRAERQTLVALLGGVLRRHHREIDEPVQQRRVGLAEHEVDGVVVHHVDPRDLGHVGAVGRLLLGIEHPLEGEADRLGVERLAVVEDDAAAQLELPRQVVEAPSTTRPAAATMRFSASRPTRESKMPTPDLRPDGREVHGGVEVLGRPRHARPGARPARLGARGRTRDEQRGAPRRRRSDARTRRGLLMPRP